MSVSQAATNTRRSADYRKRYGQVKHLSPFPGETRRIGWWDRSAPAAGLARIHSRATRRPPHNAEADIADSAYRMASGYAESGLEWTGARNLPIRRSQICMTSSRSELLTAFNRTLGMESPIFYNNLDCPLHPLKVTEVSLRLCLRVAALRGIAGVSLHLGVPFFYQRPVQKLKHTHCHTTSGQNTPGLLPQIVCLVMVVSFSAGRCFLLRSQDRRALPRTVEKAAQDTQFNYRPGVVSLSAC